METLKNIPTKCQFPSMTEIFTVTGNVDTYIEDRRLCWWSSVGESR